MDSYHRWQSSVLLWRLVLRHVKFLVIPNTEQLLRAEHLIDPTVQDVAVHSVDC